MYERASINNNHNSGVFLNMGTNSLNMHGNYVQIYGNNGNSHAGGVHFVSGNNVLRISGGTIFGRYASGTNLQQPPELRNTGDSGFFHALQSNLDIEVGGYNPNHIFGMPGTFSLISVRPVPAPGPSSGTNNTIRVSNNGTNHNATDW